MGDPFFDQNYDDLSDQEMINKIRQGVSDAEEWEQQNPDPQR